VIFMMSDAFNVSVIILFSPRLPTRGFEFQANVK